MIYTVLITGHPKNSQAVKRAFDFCKQVIEQGDQIFQVFFMHEAVFTAIDEQAKQWFELAEQYDIPLQTCVSSAELQGISPDNFHAAFQTGGLSSLADAVLSSDRVEQYG